MLATCLLHVGHMSTLCQSLVRNMLPAHLPHVSHISTSFQQQVHYMLATCSLKVNHMPLHFSPKSVICQPHACYILATNLRLTYLLHVSYIFATYQPHARYILATCPLQVTHISTTYYVIKITAISASYQVSKRLKAN